MTCTHHYLIEPATGKPHLLGTCKHCGDTKMHNASALGDLSGRDAFKRYMSVNRSRDHLSPSEGRAARHATMAPRARMSPRPLYGDSAAA